MASLELLYDYFEDHRRASASVNEGRPLALGAGCYLVGAFSLFVAQGLADRLPFAFSWPTLGLLVLWELGSGFALAAALHLILDMAGVRGSAAGLFILLGMADLVWVAAVPAMLLLKLAAPDADWTRTAAFLATALVGVSLKARSIQDNYHLSSGKAWVTLGLPYFLLIVGVLLASALALVGLVLQVVKAFG